MLPCFPIPMLGRSKTARRVGFTANASNAAVAWPAGTQAGDFAVIYICYAAGGAGAAGMGSWTRLTAAWGQFGYTDNVYGKVLTSGDVSSPPNLAAVIATDGVVLVQVYRGPTAIALRSTGLDASSGHTTISATGFVPASKSMAVVAFEGNRDATTSDVISAPGGGATCSSGFAAGAFSACSVDWLGNYAGGTVTFSGPAASTGRNLAVVELTG